MTGITNSVYYISFSDYGTRILVSFAISIATIFSGILTKLCRNIYPPKNELQQTFK